MIKIIENYSGTDSWHRKYDNGWIEQGGRVDKTFSSNEEWNFTFPYSFTTAPLSINATFIAPRSSNSYGGEVGVKTNSVTATGLTFMNDGYGTNKTGYVWEAKGF